MRERVRTLVVVAHEDRADTRLLADYAGQRALEMVVIRPYRGDELPPVDDGTAVVCLGGRMSAYDDVAFIHDEKRWLLQVFAAGNPVLGICLGSQLLAHALGGEAFRGEAGPECGYIDVRSDSTGGLGWDSLVSGRFFSFHGDTMRPPTKAAVLATSDRYIQAWTMGSALAIQFHPELSAVGLEEFFVIEADKIAAIGLDTATCMREYEASEPAHAHRFSAMLDRWLNESERTQPHPQPKESHDGNR